MNTTSSALAPAKSASETVWPSTFNSENGGALVPSGNIVLGVNTMRESPQSVKWREPARSQSDAWRGSANYRAPAERRPKESTQTARRGFRLCLKTWPAGPARFA